MSVVLRDLDPAERDGAKRLGIGFALSLLLHLLIAVVAALWVADPLRSEEAATLEVPLEFEMPSEPVAPPVTPAPDEPPEAEEQEEAETAPPDDSLLGFRSEGDVEGRPVRPVGPEAEIHAPPPPGGATEETSEIADEPDAAPEPPREETPAREPPRPEVPPEERGEPRDAADEPEPLAAEPLDPAEADDAPAAERIEPVDAGPPRELVVPPPLPRPSPQRPEGPGRSLDYQVDVHGGMFGDLRFDSRDFQWSEYSTKVYFAVYRAWLRELHARVRRFEREQKLEGHPRLDGSVDIHFFINRDGSVSELEIVAPSVLSSLDDASSAALLRAVLPPLPADFPRAREGVTFRFILSVDGALQMERGLSYRRSRGEF